MQQTAILLSLVPPTADKAALATFCGSNQVLASTIYETNSNEISAKNVSRKKNRIIEILLSCNVGCDISNWLLCSFRRLI